MDSHNRNSFSAHELNLLDNPVCGNKYNPKMFSILKPSDNKLHFSILEVLYIIKHRSGSATKNNFTNFFYSTLLILVQPPMIHSVKTTELIAPVPLVDGLSSLVFRTPSSFSLSIHVIFPYCQCLGHSMRR